MHVAEALRARVYVAAAKRAVMACLDLTPEQTALLTTNHLASNLHVVRTVVQHNTAEHGAVCS